jgi:hypothetical protein
MSALCQKQTSAGLFDHLVGARVVGQHCESDGLGSDRAPGPTSLTDIDAGRGSGMKISRYEPLASFKS